MQIKEFLTTVCSEIKYKPIRENIYNELENHIVEIKEENIQSGMENEEASQNAITQMGEPSIIGKKLDKVHRPRLDWKLLLIACVLIAFGLLVAFIKTNYTSILTDQGQSVELNYILRSVTFIIVGLVLSLGIYFFDYTKLSKYATIVYGFATLLIIYCVFFGNNYLPSFFNVSYLAGKPYLFSISLETFVIPLYIIAFAGFISNYGKNKDKMYTIGKIEIPKGYIDIFKIVSLSIISLGLVSIIPSLTSTLVLAIIYLIIATVKLTRLENNKKKYLTILYGGVGLFLILMVTVISLRSPSSFNRIFSYINPQNDPYGSGWISVNQRSILNSANLIGEADNMSNALNMFDQGNEYVFISIIAHYGWIPGIILIASILAFISKIIYNSNVIKDIYGKYLIIGLGSFFILESIFNILMNLTIGVQSSFILPFVSYNGMGIIIHMICFSMILSVYRRKDILISST